MAAACAVMAPFDVAAHGASLLQHSWEHAGLGAQRPALRSIDESGNLIVACTVCQGDMCTVRPFCVQTAASSAAEAEGRLDELLILQPPSLRLVGRLLTQPLAIAAVGGMALLAALVALAESWAPAAIPLRLLGSPLLSGTSHNGAAALVAAVVAHVGEALYALHLCGYGPLGSASGGAAGGLRMSGPAASIWAALVLVVGGPVLICLLRLKRAADAGADADGKRR